MSDPTRDYSLSGGGVARHGEAPVLPYRPPQPEKRHVIGFIGCGGISEYHLAAYQHAGFHVAALCNRTLEKARQRQARFYPGAAIYTDWRDLLRRDDIAVVDIATHPAERVEIIEAAIRAGKHVLSQKPFVLDLVTGGRLVALAEERGVRLAVNQNGRFAPHFAYARQAVAAGLIGRVTSAHFSIHWDHSWTVGTPFEEIHHLILWDFAIHWFDLINLFFAGRTPRRVFASATRAAGQRGRPPMLAQALVDFDDGQASLVFDANLQWGKEDRTLIGGSQGAIISVGPNLQEQVVTLHTAAGSASPQLEGTWFREGFQGAMAELLCAIEQNREPLNNARDNLRSLALSFAAIASATSGQPQVPGEAQQLPAFPSSRE